MLQQGGGGGGGGDKFIRNVALNLVLLGLYFVLESTNGGGGFFGGGGGDGGGVIDRPPCVEVLEPRNLHLHPVIDFRSRCYRHDVVRWYSFGHIF